MRRAERRHQEDATFRPIGLALAAVVAGIAPGVQAKPPADGSRHLVSSQLSQPAPAKAQGDLFDL